MFHLLKLWWFFIGASTPYKQAIFCFLAKAVLILNIFFLQYFTIIGVCKGPNLENSFFTFNIDWSEFLLTKELEFSNRKKIPEYHVFFHLRKIAAMSSYM